MQENPWPRLCGQIRLKFVSNTGQILASAVRRPGHPDPAPAPQRHVRPGVDIGPSKPQTVDFGPGPLPAREVRVRMRWHRDHYTIAVITDEGTDTVDPGPRPANEIRVARGSPGNTMYSAMMTISVMTVQ